MIITKSMLLASICMYLQVFTTLFILMIYFCRMEITRRQCVYNIFVESKLPCTLNDVVSMSQLPIVRAGLLDFVDIGCGMYWFTLLHSHDSEIYNIIYIFKYRERGGLVVECRTRN